MKYKICYTASYNKRASKFLKRHSHLKKQYKKTLMLLEVNPNHPSLRLHKLSGRLSDLHSVSINIQYRILIHFIMKDGFIIPVSIGHHDEVY